MNSKRLAAFAASLQWADAVKVMSRATPRSRTSVTWGIRWSVSAAKNDGESGGRFPTVRHAHLLGSHFSAVEKMAAYGILSRRFFTFKSFMNNDVCKRAVRRLLSPWILNVKTMNPIYTEILKIKYITIFSFNLLSTP